MDSESSKAKIQARAVEYFQKSQITIDPHEIGKTHKNITQFLDSEYKVLPAKERIGKGAVFLCRATAISLAEYFHNFFPNATLTPKIVLEFTKALFYIPDSRQRPFGKYIAIYFLVEFTKQSTEWFNICEPLILVWIKDTNWEIREMVIEFLIYAIKNYPEFILPKCKIWIKSEDENLRRFVAEGLRPRIGTKWLRNPTKNSPILEILSELRHDPAIYVRKSVGNNLKDLSKVMPDKVIELAKTWILDSNLKVTSDLASRSKTDLGEHNFALIWILKQALRWLNDREPKYHPQIACILGENYVNYFDEKKNRNAHPSNE
jgi:3-methyladenine DNA glycosylase AlkC